MDIRVRSVGPSFEQIARETKRELRTANRTVGRQVAKVGKAAIGKGAPRMFGRKLAVRTKVDARPAGASIMFYGKPAGGWAIQESGARAHKIRPRRATVLTIGAGFAMHANHPGAGGHQAWTKAGARLRRAVRPAIEDVYDDALGT